MTYILKFTGKSQCCEGAPGARTDNEAHADRDRDRDAAHRALVSVAGGDEDPAAEEEEARQAEAAEAAERRAGAEERRKGFHCLSKWDGNHDGLEALIRDRLSDPGSMETIETLIAPVNPEGDHKIWLDFTAKNAFGGRVRSIAYGLVSQATCEATLVQIE